MWQYGPVEVEIRMKPVKHARLREYVRREMEPGTEVGYLLRQAAESTRRTRNRVGPAVSRALRALAKAFGVRASIFGR